MWRQCRNGNAQCTNRPQIFTYWRKVPAKLILTTLPILSIMRVCEECGAYCHVSPHRLGTTSKITLSDSAPRKFQKKKNTSNLKTFDTLKWWHPQLIFNSGDLIQRAHFFQKNGFPVPTKIWIWLETSTINRGWDPDASRVRPETTRCLALTCVRRSSDTFTQPDKNDFAGWWWRSYIVTILHNHNCLWTILINSVLSLLNSHHSQSYSLNLCNLYK